MIEKKDVVRQTDAEAIRLAKTLLRSARYAALATVEMGTGHPLATRVGMATDADGTPLILISGLSAHTPALLADPRCSLLLGEPGKGDPLAHPRLTLFCRAGKVARDDPAVERIGRRYLNRNPKAKLYAGLGDFAFFRLEIERAALNGGFGKAYLLTREDLVTAGEAVEALAANEQRAADHMNDDHLDAIALYASHFGGNRQDLDWTIGGIDVDGMDLVAGDIAQRVFFPQPLTDASQLRPVLVDMARTARLAAEASSPREEA